MSALIITDGGIAGFLACWSEGVARPSDTPRLRDNAEVGGPVAWIDPRATAPGSAAALRASAVCQMVAVVQGRPAMSIEATTALPGFGDSAVLLAAGIEAIRRGLNRVVWPVHIGGPWAASNLPVANLEAIADVFDRALLAARLLSVDARPPAHPAELRIETPFVDLGDASLLDLAADMDAPLKDAWWCRAGTDALEAPCGQCASCKRWAEAATAAGLSWEDLGVARVG